MPEVAFADFNQGQLSDPPAHRIPDTALVEARNVRLRDGAVYPRPGRREVVPATMNDLNNVTDSFNDSESPDTLVINHYAKHFAATSTAQTLMACTERDILRWLGLTYNTGTFSSATAAVIVMTGSNFITGGAGTPGVNNVIMPGDCFRVKHNPATGEDYWGDYFVIASVDKTTQFTLTASFDEDDTDILEWEILRIWRFLTPLDRTGASYGNLAQGVGVITPTGGIGTVATATTDGTATIAINDGFLGDISAGDYIMILEDAGADDYHRKWYRINSIASPNITVDQAYAGTNITASAYLIRKTYSGTANNRWTSRPFPGFPTAIDAMSILSNNVETIQAWDGSDDQVEDLSKFQSGETLVPTENQAAGGAQVQITHVTPGATIHADDVYSIYYAGQKVSFAAVAGALTVADVVDGLVTAWGAKFGGVTASDGTTHLILTHDTNDTPFTVSCFVDHGATAQTAKYIEVFANRLVLSANYDFKWGAFGDPRDFSISVFNAAGGGPLTDDISQVTGLHVIVNRIVVLKQNSIWTFVASGTIPALIKESFFAGHGNEIPFASAASENRVIFTDRDGLYLFDAINPPENISQNRIWKKLNGELNWAQNERGWSYFSGRTRDFVMVYPHDDAPPTKAICINADSGAYSFWTWATGITAYTDWEESTSLVWDDIEKLFPWSPRDIDGVLTLVMDDMPWSTLDSIGVGTEFLAEWVSTSNGKFHRYDNNFDDNGTAIEKFIETKTTDFGSGDFNKFIRQLRLDGKKHGSNLPFTIEVWYKFHLNEDWILGNSSAVVLSEDSAPRVDLRNIGKYFRFIIKSSNNNDQWRIFGLFFDVERADRRDNRWDLNAAQVGGSGALGGEAGAAGGGSGTPVFGGKARA